MFFHPFSCNQLVYSYVKYFTGICVKLDDTFCRLRKSINLNDPATSILTVTISENAARILLKAFTTSKHNHYFLITILYLDYLEHLGYVITTRTIFPGVNSSQDRKTQNLFKSSNNCTGRLKSSNNDIASQTLQWGRFVIITITIRTNSINIRSDNIKQ